MKFHGLLLSGLLIATAPLCGQSAIYQEGVSGGSFAETLGSVVSNSGGDGQTTESTTMSLGDGRGFLAFPSVIGASAGQVPPGAVISSATLELYVINIAGVAPTRILAVHPVYDLFGQGPWHEPTALSVAAPSIGVSWGSRDARPGINVPWSLPGGDIARLGPPFSASVALTTGAGFWVSLDVTAVVAAHAQGFSNQGFSLEVNRSGQDLVLASDDHPNPALRPRLSVNWNGAGVPYNHVPAVADQALSTPVSVSRFIPLPLTDPDGTVLTYVVRDAPAHGSLQGSGWFSYVPDAGFIGQDAFTVFAHDGFASSRLARITISVNPSAGNTTTTFSTANASVRATTVLISEDLNSQQTEETTELRVESGVRAAFVDFSGLIGSTQIPLGSTILSASLELTETVIPASASPRTYAAKLLLDPSDSGAWYEPTGSGLMTNSGVSWLYRDARLGVLTPWLIPGGEGDEARSVSTTVTGTSTASAVTFNVTAALQAMALGTKSSGFRIEALTAGETRFASDEHGQTIARPRLSVTWRGPATVPSPVPPIAVAGADRTVFAGQPVSLDGSASYDPDGQPLLYLWVQTSGTAVTLSDPTASVLTFVAPSVVTETALVFTLLVNDGTSNVLDDVSITVLPPNGSALAPPVAEAGPSQSVVEGDWVLLDGFESVDPEGQPLTFSWAQVDGPAVSLFVLPVTSRVLFQAPPVTGMGSRTLFFRLTVSDGAHESHDWVLVRVFPSANIAPIVVVSPAFSVRSGRWAGLDARGSSDPDPYTQLSYSWAQAGGPSATLFREDSPVPYFQAPIVSVPTSLVFEVTVSDGIESTVSGVTVTVEPSPAEFGGGAQSLASYTDNITPSEARHLLRRAGFSASPAAIDAVVAGGLAATVNQLLAPYDEPLLDLAAWAHLPAPVGQDVYPRATAEEAARWWLTYMQEAAIPNQLREKIAYFFHDRFAASGRVAEGNERHWVMEHLDFLRSHPFPNYRSFLIEITQNSLMLDWLDGHDNVVSAPNENYAREFWELFTLGETHPFTGVFNYTENDIQEAARALTGWETYDPATIAGNSRYSRFNPSRFDSGLKVVFGQVGPWNGTDIIDLTLARPQAAEYLCYKLFRFFVHDEPDLTTVQAMAQTLTSNNWEVSTVVSQLLKSEAMFSATARRSLIKTATEFLIGFARETGLRIPLDEMAERLADLSHEMGNPPDVKGWEEGVFQLGAAASSLRAQGINALAYSGYLPSGVSLQAFLPAVEHRNGPQTVARVLELLDIATLDPMQFHLLVDYMDGRRSGSGQDQTVWFDGNVASDVELKLRGLLFLIAVSIPEYQLN